MLMPSLWVLSATAVRGVTPRGDQQRNMIVLRRVGDGESNRYLIDEWRVRELHAACTEILGHMKRQTILTRPQPGFVQQRLPETPVLIRTSRREQTRRRGHGAI